LTSTAEARGDTSEGFEKRYREKAKRLERNILLQNLKSAFIFDPLFEKMDHGIGTASGGDL